MAQKQPNPPPSGKHPAPPPKPPRATTCDDCKHRSGWRTAFVTTGPQKMVVADCMHPNWPEWWKARNERPVVSPGAGSACNKYERREFHNVRGEAGPEAAR